MPNTSQTAETPIDFVALEHAAFRAWPALQQAEHQGVVLRFANGYTKRANSANVLEPPQGDLEPWLAHYQAAFKAQNLPCIFRLPTVCQQQRLDDFLQSKGFRQIDKSHVLVKSLMVDSGLIESLNKSASVRMIEKTHEQWIASYCAINEVALGDHQTHLDMLKRIEDKTLMLVLTDGEQELACGLGVLSGQYFGLFDIATKKIARNQGFANQLISAMLAWAVQQGANYSYLQVVADNQAAIRLYKKLGYQHGYDYWYRISAE
ncbi:GNAT family N-acetyltransferase [Reinekea thalattae]|uniref:GNAT family N-acetyltransferase n=1 Tax=Reinekea thalattae TaxID=2593301 RepID=A0A5C8Z9K0_9GAMM|nr:GNAT family N-acetyltransferase [Reinekea thalattae]TXR53831.1 GNAT family N-acetyltransferase [Reinekea thalattae]